ncbi:MAG: Imidazole glycerol phosphate synthase subunit HisH [Candidatus Dichloromethanomonas elyunquensis]|nr:MAG: Imidazole glycerol phosphate synthase subunit HisH [Candidatus Dichloromethanomonas elyunquensis]
MIGIIDYGRGNLRSVEKALEKLGYEALIMTSPQEIGEVKGIILPGVGAFADAMTALDRGEWIAPLQKYVQKGNPFLGICLGMQLLFEIGEEHGEYQGLGFLPGRVIKFPPGLKIPHMGWNTLKILYPNVICENIPNESHFYFVHSYYAKPKDPACIAATSDYGFDFPAVVGKENVWGAQFHPEKSSPWGLVMLENFGKWVNES